MSLKCAVFGCTNESGSNPDLDFFQFPPEREKALNWLENIKRLDLKDLSMEELCDQYYVCGEHFEDGKQNDDQSSEENADERMEESGNEDVAVHTGDHSYMISDEANLIDEKVISDEDGKTVFFEGVANAHLKPDELAEDEKYVVYLMSEDGTLEAQKQLVFVQREDGQEIVNTDDALIEAGDDSQLQLLVKQEDVKSEASGGVDDEQLVVDEQGLGVDDDEEFESSDMIQIENSVEKDGGWVFIQGSDGGSRKRTVILQNIHNGNIEELAIAGEAEIEEDERMSARKTRVKLLQFLCEECGQSFPNAMTLREHISVRHYSDATFKCSDCGQGFEMFDMLKLHIRSHQPKEFRCDECGVAFSHRSNLSRHKLQHCSEKKFMCDICGKGFNVKSDLITHNAIHVQATAMISDPSNNRVIAERIHRKPKMHSCDQCGKGFASLSGLRNHGAIHSGHRPFVCINCQKGFTLLSCLKTHLATIHSNKRHVCELCGKGYMSEHYLKIHLRIHSGTKEYECNFCTKKFIDQPSLKLHMRTHTGEKPYTCTICNRAFTQQSHLKTHSRIHTGEKPYSCQDCGKSFRQLSNVLEHGRTHKSKH